jgi:hypothetical protein
MLPQVLRGAWGGVQTTKSKKNRKTNTRNPALSSLMPVSKDIHKGNKEGWMVV